MLAQSIAPAIINAGNKTKSTVARTIPTKRSVTTERPRRILAPTTKAQTYYITFKFCVGRCSTGIRVTHRGLGGLPALTDCSHYKIYRPKR